MVGIAEVTSGRGEEEHGLLVVEDVRRWITYILVEDPNSIFFFSLVLPDFPRLPSRNSL